MSNLFLKLSSVILITALWQTFSFSEAKPTDSPARPNEFSWSSIRCNLQCSASRCKDSKETYQMCLANCNPNSIRNCMSLGSKEHNKQPIKEMEIPKVDEIPSVVDGPRI